MKSNIRAIIAWCLYDWGGAAFSVIITTFIFATYFTTQIAKNEIVGTYQWANATSIAGLIIAIMSPIVGAIADFGGYHKRWLFAFTMIAITFSALLWFSYPSTHAVFFTLTSFVIGTVGFEIALVFYNSFLPFLARSDYLGRISGWGWGAGYFGGIVALSIALFVFVKTPVAWLDTKTAAQIRICGPFVALWYFVFSLPLFLFVPSISTVSRPLKEAVVLGIRQLIKTLKELRHEKNILLYLISHMIYTDGLNTLFAFGGIYAAGTYGLSFQEVLVFGITINITAGIGAILLSWLDDYLGSKPTVIFSLLCLIVLGTLLLLLHSKVAFWCVALLLGIFVGPVQSASRTLMVRLITEKKLSTEMFGLYALSGRITAFISPWLLGTMTLAFNSQRAGMATILFFFLIGAITLLPVRIQNSA